jgi:hypothetical protein
MVSRHAWAGRTTSGHAPILKGRDWVSLLWDPVLYIIAVLLCAILAIDAFVLLHAL